MAYHFLYLSRNSKRAPPVLVSKVLSNLATRRRRGTNTSPHHPLRIRPKLPRRSQSLPLTPLALGTTHPSSTRPHLPSRRNHLRKFPSHRRRFLRMGLDRRDSARHGAPVQRRSVAAQSDYDFGYFGGRE